MRAQSECIEQHPGIISSVYRWPANPQGLAPGVQSLWTKVIFSPTPSGNKYLTNYLDKCPWVPMGAPQGEAADWCIKRESPLDVRLHNYDLVPRAFSIKKWVGREKALCEKLKLGETSRRAIFGGLLYLLTINEKFYEISFLSQTLAMVIFCFPLISMKGTASNIWKTSVYRAV